MVLLGLAPPLGANPVASREALSAAYYRALGLWAEDRRTEGVERLLELDASQHTGFEHVGRARELAYGRPQLLVPVLAAHGDLHALELARAVKPPHHARHLFLAAEQRRGLDQLAAHYLERAGERARDPAVELAARRFVARLWCRLAVSLRVSAELENAVEYFRRASQLDPQLAAAHQASGAIYEKLGRYDVAAEYFERVLEIVPEHAEARLRLALCRARGGGRTRAGELLEQVVRDPGPRWVRNVAYEEWVQLRLHEKRSAERLEILAAARQEFPESEKLALLELYLRADRSPVSTALMAKLLEPKGFASVDVTPRFIYNLWPADLEAALAEYDAEIRKYLPLLAEATRPWRQKEP